MIKVEQQEVDKGTGDCMRASIASVLETDLQAVPHFTRTDKEKWFSVLYYFMVSYGFIYSGTWWPVRGKEELKESDSINGFYLVSVTSRTYEESEGITHMVIMDCNWNVIHDPHPNKLWQDECLIDNPGLQHVYQFRKMNDTDKKYWHYV